MSTSMCGRYGRYTRRTPSKMYIGVAEDSGYVSVKKQLSFHEMLNSGPSLQSQQLNQFNQRSLFPKYGSTKFDKSISPCGHGGPRISRVVGRKYIQSVYTECSQD